MWNVMTGRIDERERRRGIVLVMFTLAEEVGNDVHTFVSVSLRPDFLEMT